MRGSTFKKVDGVGGLGEDVGTVTGRGGDTPISLSILNGGAFTFGYF